MTTRIRLEQWERRAEWPLAGLALVFLAVYSALQKAIGKAFPGRIAVYTVS